MDSRKNARLTPKGRKAMVRAVMDSGLSQAVAARHTSTSRSSVGSTGSAIASPVILGAEQQPGRRLGLRSRRGRRSLPHRLRQGHAEREEAQLHHLPQGRARLLPKPRRQGRARDDRQSDSRGRRGVATSAPRSRAGSPHPSTAGDAPLHRIAHPRDQHEALRVWTPFGIGN